MRETERADRDWTRTMKKNDLQDEGHQQTKFRVMRASNEKVETEVVRVLLKEAEREQPG
jgi:hypothetical protein